MRLIHWVRVGVARAAGTFSRSSRNLELDEELREHLDALTEENMRRGMTPEHARCAARREFGGMEQTKESYRDQRALPFLDALLQDLRFAARTLAKQPNFTVAAILTLALGIGASTAVFSVVDRILFRNLPYPNSDRLVSFGVKAPFESVEFMLGPDYVEWRSRETPFASVTSISPGGDNCDLTQENPVHLSCAAVESTLLSTFGVRPILGRDFSREDNRPNASPVALISSGLWHSRYGGDPGVVGKAISLNDRAVRLVGVLPADFEMPTGTRPDLLIAAERDESTDRSPNARQMILRAYARLKPGVSIAEAYAAIQPLYRESLQYVPPQFRHEVSFWLRSLRDAQIADSRLTSWMLLGAVLTVLLAACTNVANLLLARATTRQRELAVRAALGATRIRLVFQSLVESVLLGVLSGGLGAGLAFFLLRLFLAISPAGIPRLDQARIDLRVLAFTLAISLFSGVLFGLAPALRTPTATMLCGKEAHATGRVTLRQVLVTIQVALSLVLLAGAGLLLSSLWRLQAVPLGIQPESILTAELTLSSPRYAKAEQQIAFFQDVETRLRRIPGLAALGLSNSMPPLGPAQATFLSAIEISGYPRHTEGTGGMIGYRTVTPGYFTALGIPVLRGRAFREDDRTSSQNLVILSGALAKQLFPSDLDPVGKQFRFGLNGPWRTIIGVVSDVKNHGLAAPPDPEFYLPWKADSQGFYRSGHFLVRSQIDSRAMSAWLRGEVAGLDATLPVTIESLTERVGKLTARPRFNAILLSLFAAIGMLLAAVGIYGVVSFLVTERTPEIAVRMALGAAPSSVLQMILFRVSGWLVAGAVIGLLGALAVTRSLQSLLFEVQPRDPLLLGLALAVLYIVGLAAAWFPARRATLVDPIVALRYE